MDCTKNYSFGGGLPCIIARIAAMSKFIYLNIGTRHEDSIIYQKISKSLKKFPCDVGGSLSFQHNIQVVTALLRVSTSAHLAKGKAHQRLVKSVLRIHQAKAQRACFIAARDGQSKRR